MSNDWTNKLRDQLADYQEPVSHDLWAGIEQSLAQSTTVDDKETDVKKAPQTRVVALKRWSVAAAIALLGVGGSYVYLHDDEPGQANLAVQRSFSTAAGSDRTSSVRAEAQSAGSKNVILFAENNESAHQLNHHLVGRQLNHSKSSLSSQDRIVAVDNDNEIMLAAEVEMPERPVDAEANGQDLSVLQKQNEDSERQMAASSNATKPLEVDDRQKLYAGRVYDEHFERSYKDKYEQTWTMNLYAENVSLGTGSDGMSNGMYASSDPLAGGGFADHGVFLAASPLRYAIPKYVEAKHHAPLAIGAQVGIGLAPRLSLSTGVVYTRVASDFKSYGVSDFDTHQVLHYVGVPLGLNYEVWSTGGFHAYVMAGGEADFNVKNDTKVSGHKEDVKRDGVQFSGKASLGAQYNVTPQVGFYIEPGAKYYFDNGSEIENTFKDKKWNFNLQFGLRINLK